MADNAAAEGGEEGSQGISLKALSMEQLKQIKEGLEEVRGIGHDALRSPELTPAAVLMSRA